MSNVFDLACVLFDLDGTLLHTAPDLTTALNRALIHFGFPETSIEHITPYISYGAAVMIETALQQTASHEDKANILRYLLEYYAQNIAVDTALYPGISGVLMHLEAHDIPWGVVTNKREKLALPLMKALNLNKRSGSIICGDTTKHSKPHPEPMLAACQEMHVTPEFCLYIGDAEHDITAGKAAGMRTLAATYGYLKPNDQPQYWGADALVHHPSEILDWIMTNTCL